MSTEEKQKRGVFVKKLRQILDDPEYQEMIRWSKKGNSIIIPDMVTLEIELLPRIFKTAQASSFVRQLNLYGFKKKVVPSEDCIGSKIHEFYHPLFLRDGPNIDITGERTKKVTPNTQIQNQIEELNEKIQALSVIQNNLLQQNQTFFDDITLIRNKQESQSESITKILKFLYNYLGNNRKDFPIQQNKFSTDIPAPLNNSMNANGIALPQNYVIQAQQFPVLNQSFQTQPNILHSINLNDQNYDNNFIRNSQINNQLPQPITYNNSLLTYQPQDFLYQPQYLNVFTTAAPNQQIPLQIQTNMTNSNSIYSIESQNTSYNNSTDQFEIEPDFINRFMKK